MLTELMRPEYEPAREHAWHLSIWMAPGLHGWCVHERSTGMLAALHVDAGDGLPAQDRLPTRPAGVSFTALPETATLVPESALLPGSEMRHLKLVHGPLPTGLLRDEPIGPLGARCIYLHDEAAERSLMARFPHARSLPLQGTLAQTALARSAQGTAMVLHRSELRMDLAIARENKLLLCNGFHATVAEDLLYYALFALEQCRTAVTEAQLFLCGTHLEEAEEDLLGRYFTTAPLLPPAETLGKGDEAAERLHRWAGLLEQFPCAL